MKAVALFPKGREVKVIDVPEPKLRSPTQVRVRTLEVVLGTVNAAPEDFEAAVAGRKESPIKDVIVFSRG